MKISRLSSFDLLTIFLLIGKWSGFFDIGYFWVFLPLIVHITLLFLNSSVLYLLLSIKKVKESIKDYRSIGLAIKMIEAERKIFCVKPSDYAWNGALDRCINILNKFR